MKKEKEERKAKLEDEHQVVSKNFKMSSDPFLAFKERKYQELDDIVKCQEAERSRRLEAGEDLPMTMNYSGRPCNKMT